MAATAPSERPSTTRKTLWIAAAAAVAVLAVIVWARLRDSPKPDPIELKAEPNRTAQQAVEPRTPAAAPTAAEAQAPDEQTEPASNSDKKTSRRAPWRRRWWAKPGLKAPDSDKEPEPESEPAPPPATEPEGSAAAVTAVTLTVVPPSTLVYRGGQAEGTTPLTYGVKKGERLVLRLVKEGYVTQSAVLDGSRKTVRVVMAKAGAAATQGKTQSGDKGAAESASTPNSASGTLGSTETE